ncbi:MAG: ATP-binding protein [Opitutales bacterium]
MSDLNKRVADLRAQLTAKDAELDVLKNMLGSLGVSTELNADIQLGMLHELESEGARIASVGVWQYDLDAKEMYWTPEVFRIHGLPVGKVPTLDQSIDFYAQGDQARVRSAVEKLASEGLPYDIDCEFYDADGEHHFVRIVGHVRSSLIGKPRILSGIIQDITGQHTMRRGMEAFFTLTPDFVGAIDFQSRPVTLSPSWQRELGWSKYEMFRLGIDCIVRGDEQQALRDVVGRAIQSGKIESIENRVLSKEGEEFWFSWRLFADPGMELVFISARDVTRRKATEQSLKDAKLQSEQASQAKSDFLAIMSHELRTPLNPILGFADLLISETDNPEHLEILQAISQAGQHLTTIIGDVLDFAKIEAGRTDVEEDEFNMKQFLEEQVRLIEGQRKGKPVRLALKHDADSGIGDAAICVADREKITRIVYNLVGNAVKFTEAGTVTLDSSLKLADEGRALWHLDIRDTGIGIPEHSIEDIFEPFSQADTSTTRRYGGTGLGLAICKKLVELIGGQISIKSRLGSGTCFSLAVPVTIIERSRSDSGSHESAVEDIALACKPRVLLVEDNPTNIFYIRRLLERMGATVSCTFSGEEAIAAYAPDLFDMVLLDVHMPGISGIDVLQSIRADEDGSNQMPILMLTADVLPATREQCMKSGASGFLTKPIRAKELHKAIAEICLEPN